MMNNWGFTVDNPKKNKNFTTYNFVFTTLFNQREKCDLVSLKVLPTV